MNTYENLDTFMKEKFPGLVLESPLFYNAPVGIRFDLCGEYIMGKRESSEPVERACALFHSLTKDTDQIFAAIFIDAWEGHPFESFHPEILSFYEKHFAAEESDLTITRHPSLEDGDLVHVRFCKAAFAGKLDIRGMLEAKVNASYSEEANRLEGDLYLINRTNASIFHLYNAKGLDIIAANKQTLKSLYNNYPDWILEWDREEINRRFANGNSGDEQ